MLLHRIPFLSAAIMEGRMGGVKHNKSFRWADTAEAKLKPIIMKDMRARTRYEQLTLTLT